MQAGDPLRIFYTSTQRQIAGMKDGAGLVRRSVMSEKWRVASSSVPPSSIAEILDG